MAALGLTPIASGFQGSDIDFEDDNISPEISLTYAINDDISVYGAYKTGFKSGGIDNNSLPTGGLVVVILKAKILLSASHRSMFFNTNQRSQMAER